MEGSKFLISAPKCTRNRLVSYAVIGPTPDAPRHRASHVAATSLPTGVTSPIPVTTTRDNVSPAFCLLPLLYHLICVCCHQKKTLTFNVLSNKIRGSLLPSIPRH